MSAMLLLHLVLLLSHSSRGLLVGGVNGSHKAVRYLSEIINNSFTNLSGNQSVVDWMTAWVSMAQRHMKQEDRQQNEQSEWQWNFD